MGQNPPMNKRFARFSAETKALEDTRSLIVTISTDTPDRDGDVVVPKGGKFENFLKNPVVLFGHKYNEPFIARADELVPGEHDIKAKVTFPKAGIHPFADMLYELSKFLPPSWSIGFRADPEATERLPGGGLKFNSWELLEFSLVPVPANPEARTILRSKGFTDDQIKEVIEEEEEELETSKSEVVEVTIGVDLDQIAFTLSDGKTYQHDITPELKELLLPAPEPTEPQIDAVKTLQALRDALKPADKEIGLALRTLKSLLEKPKQEGGDN